MSKCLVYTYFHFKRLQLHNIVNYWLASNVVNQCLNYFEWYKFVILFYIIIFKLIFFLIFPFNFSLRFVPANDGSAVSPKRNLSILMESGHWALQQPHSSINYKLSFSRLWWLCWLSFECSLSTSYPERFTHILTLLPWKCGFTRACLVLASTRRRSGVCYERRWCGALSATNGTNAAAWGSPIGFSGSEIGLL